MIIVKVWGGIGNQLFQYVFGQYIKYRYNQIVKYDDNSYRTTDKLRKKELDILETEIDYDNRCSFSRHKGIKKRILTALFRLNPKNYYYDDWCVLPTNFEENKLYYFHGYWQNGIYYKWLCDNVPEFRIVGKLFPEELNKYADQIKKAADSVSLHIRRGDFFSPQNIKKYGVCTPNYYNDAIGKIIESIPNARFFVFSDDLEWVSKNIVLPPNSEIINNYNISPFAYIELMALCKHHIISNSSFSWWGAVLNEQDGSVVISPRKWVLTSDRTIALEKWMKIE